MTPRDFWEHVSDHDLDRAGLTPAQMDAAILATAGISTYQAPALLGITRSAYRDRLREAVDKITRTRQEADR